ncbi:ABC transporter ATP-binding protein [Deferrisoma palaeochoriense]
MEPSHAVEVLDLWKTYARADGPALQGVTFAVRPGEVVAVVGRSGSGKTTLLNLVAGLDRPDRGTVQVAGQDLRALGEHGRTRLRRERLGFVFQFFNLLPTLTARENVLLALELRGRADPRRADEALEAVGLADKAHRYPHELSGGEQQRVAVARALVKDPAAILADEPTGNLDTRTGDEVLALLCRAARDRGAALVMATHSERAARAADRVLRMADGRLTEDVSP